MHKFINNQSGFSLLGLLISIIVIAGLVYAGDRIVTDHSLVKADTKVTVTTPKQSSASNVVVSSPPNPCSGNSLEQLILVSTSQRHLWACDAQAELYNSPVITGMDFLAADITPTGTYHIYAKEQDVYLKGSDSTGSWDDYVYYWMPFLDNQYGEYGLHDATWRTANQFGNISPDSNQASHGCVEMPLTTAAWIYNWAVIGTTVTIES